MKRVIIKSFADDYDCDHQQTDEQINRLSHALTKKFLKKDGVLFQRLLNQFHLVPNIRLVLMAEHNKANEVKSLRLCIDRKDLWMTQAINNYEKQLRGYDGGYGKLFHRTRAEYNPPKYPRGYEYIFSVDERATTNYRRVFNHKN